MTPSYHCRWVKLIAQMRRPDVSILMSCPPSSFMKLLGHSKRNLCGASMVRGFSASGSHDQDGQNAHIW